MTSCVPVPDAPTTPIGPRRIDVGEAERNAVDDGGAAIGSHHHQVVVARVRLERQLALGRHVVAEQHDIHAEPQRLHRLGGGVVARHRDQREIVARILGDRHLDAGERLRAAGRPRRRHPLPSRSAIRRPSPAPRRRPRRCPTRRRRGRWAGPRSRRARPRSRLSTLVADAMTTEAASMPGHRHDLGGHRHQRDRILVEVGIIARTGSHAAALSMSRQKNDGANASNAHAGIGTGRGAVSRHVGWRRAALEAVSSDNGARSTRARRDRTDPALAWRSSCALMSVVAGSSGRHHEPDERCRRAAAPDRGRREHGEDTHQHVITGRGGARARGRPRCASDVAQSFRHTERDLTASAIGAAPCQARSGAAAATRAQAAADARRRVSWWRRLPPLRGPAVHHSTCAARPDAHEARPDADAVARAQVERTEIVRRGADPEREVWPIGCQQRPHFATDPEIDGMRKDLCTMPLLAPSTSSAWPIEMA